MEKTGSVTLGMAATVASGEGLEEASAATSSGILAVGVWSEHRGHQYDYSRKVRSDMQEVQLNTDLF